jgi:hypothetical protein
LPNPAQCPPIERSDRNDLSGGERLASLSRFDGLMLKAKLCLLARISQLAEVRRHDRYAASHGWKSYAAFRTD